MHGDAALANELWRSGFDMAQGNAGFAKLLAEASGSVAPGITMLGGIRTEDGRIDLKRAGLFGIVTLARVLDEVDLAHDPIVVVADHGHTGRGGHGGRWQSIPTR